MAPEQKIYITIWIVLGIIIAGDYVYKHLKIYKEIGAWKLIWRRRVPLHCAGKRIFCATGHLLECALKDHGDFRPTDIFFPKYIHHENIPEKFDLGFRLPWGKKRIFIVSDDLAPQISYWKFLVKHTKTYLLVVVGEGEQKRFALKKLLSVDGNGKPVFA